MANPIEPKTARIGVLLTPSDTTVYAPPFDALYVGGAGTVKAVDETDNNTPYGAGVGTVIPVRCKAVYNTSTTATLIVGLRY